MCYLVAVFVLHMQGAENMCIVFAVHDLFASASSVPALSCDRIIGSV